MAAHYSTIFQKNVPDSITRKYRTSRTFKPARMRCSVAFCCKCLHVPARPVNNSSLFTPNIRTARGENVHARVYYVPPHSRCGRAIVQRASLGRSHPFILVHRQITHFQRNPHILAPVTHPSCQKLVDKDSIFFRCTSPVRTPCMYHVRAE